MHAELCDGFLLCLVIDGVSHILIIVIAFLLHRLLSCLYTLCVGEVCRDGETCNLFQFNHTQIYLCQSEHTVSKFYVFADMLLLGKCHFGWNGKYVECVCALGIGLGHHGFGVFAIDGLRGGDGGLCYRLLSLQVNHPTLQGHLWQSLQAAGDVVVGGVDHIHAVGRKQILHGKTLRQVDGIFHGIAFHLSFHHRVV